MQKVILYYWKISKIPKVPSSESFVWQIVSLANRSASPSRPVCLPTNAPHNNKSHFVLLLDGRNKKRGGESVWWGSPPPPLAPEKMIPIPHVCVCVCVSDRPLQPALWHVYRCLSHRLAWSYFCNIQSLLFFLPMCSCAPLPAPHAAPPRLSTPEIRS